MQTRQLYASVTATISGTTYVELPTSARIRGIQIFSAGAGAGTAGDQIQVEVSTVAVNQTATNDAVGVLAIGGFTIGAAGGMVNSQWVACDCQCKAGDRIYLNVTEVGTSTWLVRAIIHYT